MALHVWPFGGDDAVHHRVAHRAVAARRVVADDAVLLRAERLDRALRGEIEIVGAQADDLAAERVERVAEEEQLAHAVEVRLLPASCVPRVADLDPLGFSYD